MSCAPPLPLPEPRPGGAPGETLEARAPCARSALDLTLEVLRPLLSDPEVTELCINRPREVFLETRSGWRAVAAPFADFDWCQRFAKLVANATRQDTLGVDVQRPRTRALLGKNAARIGQDAARRRLCAHDLPMLPLQRKREAAPMRTRPVRAAVGAHIETKLAEMSSYAK